MRPSLYEARLSRPFLILNSRFGLWTPDVRSVCFVIGAMKSGTTTLFRHLVQHPDITPSWRRKEIDFFSRRTGAADAANFYREFPRSIRPDAVAIDGSTSYTKLPYFPDAAERIKAIPAKKHFVYIVRNPFDRIESHLGHNIAQNRVSADEARAMSNLTHYVSVSNYAQQLDAYAKAFPDTPIKVLTLDALKADISGVLSEVCTQIGVDPAFRFDVLPPQNTRSKKSGAQSVRLSTEQRARVYERLHEDMMRFGDTYNVDVAAWGFE